MTNTGELSRSWISTLRADIQAMERDIDDARQKVRMAERLQWETASRGDGLGKSAAIIAVVQRIKANARKELRRMEQKRDKMQTELQAEEREREQREEKQREREGEKREQQRSKQRSRNGGRSRRDRDGGRDRDDDFDRDL